MKPRRAPHKAFRPRLQRLVTLALPLALACAESPAPPGDDNHAPQVVSIAISGGKPVIAAGTLNVLLQAVTSDIDGDDLTLTWSGPGSFHNVDNTAKTVRWDVPAGQYGELTVTCTASDGVATGSKERDIPVGRALTTLDYGTQVGNQVTWSPDEAPFYVMLSDVEIPSGVELRVSCTDSDSLTIWCDSNTRLTIGGSFTVEGSANYDVVFRHYGAGSSAPGLWDGIVFASSGGSLAMSQCVLRNAAVGLNLELGTGTGAALANCGIFDCGDAITLGFGELALSGCWFTGFGTGIAADFDATLAITNCNFDESSGEAIVVRGGAEGSCSGSYFGLDLGTPIINQAGGGRLICHGNRFFGTGTAFLVGAGYGVDPEPLDARCNWWGVDNINEAAIIARILSSGGDPATLIYTPWQATPGAACGDDPPAVLVHVAVVFDERHPLWDEPPVGVDLSVMNDDGYPRLLVVTVEPQHDGFVHAYDWSASAGGTLFRQATVWPAGPSGTAYPGQRDDVNGSAIFCVPAGAGGETMSVTITDNWGASTGSATSFVY